MTTSIAPQRDPSQKPTPRSGRRGWIGRLFADVLFVAMRDKKWWLLPLVLLLLILTALLAFATMAGPLAPFIYPLL
jgi:hypothetical protein